jgi:hypothetical protein
MRYAKSVNNTIVNIYISPEGFTIFDCFHPSLACEYFEADESIQLGYVLQEDGTWAEPPIVEEDPIAEEAPAE